MPFLDLPPSLWSASCPHCFAVVASHAATVSVRFALKVNAGQIVGKHVAGTEAAENRRTQQRKISSARTMEDLDKSRSRSVGLTRSQERLEVFMAAR